ncbi:MAG: AsnC family transcriptional regulator [Bacteroidetes bacterium 4572_117]|nr:MAG: AsnC family transcriptional regulator [Bacteroidetes bacterium 4572_117]
MDKIDKEILNILQDNGRITNSALAEKIKISPPPTLERVKKLEKNGFIKKYVALVDPAKIGIETFTFVEVTLKWHGKNAVSEFIEKVKTIDEIMECHHTIGSADFLMKIACSNIAAYEELVLGKLTDLPNILHLKTMVVLSTFKDETAFNIKG